MTAAKLQSRLEAAIGRWDAEFEEREARLEKHFADTTDFDRRMQEESAEIEQSLAEANARFDMLLNLLGKEHVTHPFGEIDERDFPRIEELGEFIYPTAMRSLRLTRDFDAFRQLRGIEVPLDSLKRKVRIHFLLAEWYVALGIRLDPSLEDKSAKAEYLKVIKEGEPLFRALEEQGNALVKRLRVAHNVAASYKRLYDLYEEAEKSERYGFHGDSEERHELIEKAREWYHKTFDIANITKSLDVRTVFSTAYEFRRYLKDIEELEAGCVFQLLYEDREAFRCNSPYQCPRKHTTGSCYHIHGTETHKDNRLRIRMKRKTPQPT